MLQNSQAKWLIGHRIQHIMEILQEGGSKGKILNIAAYDPQRWNSVIDLWKRIIIADFIKIILKQMQKPCISI